MGGGWAGRGGWLVGQGTAAAAREAKTETCNGNFAGEKEKEIGNGQTVMNSFVGIYHGVENKEIYLWAVVVVAVTRRFARKSSLEVCRKSSLF